MNTTVISSLLAASFLYASPAAAQEEDTSSNFVIIGNAWARPEYCNQGNAREVPFSTVATDTDALIGQCVTFAGYWSGYALFLSVEDALSNEAQFDPSLKGKRIGLYANWELIGDLPDEPRWQRFVGNVGMCETQWPEGAMVMGYCHSTDGPILLVSEAISDDKTDDR